MASQIVIIRFKIHPKAPGVCGPDSKAMIWQVRSESGARIRVVPRATVTATGSGTEPEGPVITDEPGPLLVSIVTVTVSALLIWAKILAPSFCAISSGSRLALMVLGSCQGIGRVIVSSKSDLT